MTDEKSQALLAEIDKLTQQPGFAYALALAIRRDLFLNPSEAADVDWRSRLTYQEITLVSGLLVKRPVNLDEISSKQAEAYIKELRDLLDKLHKVQMDKFFADFPTDADELRALPDEKKEVAFNALFGKGEHMVEPMFYGDSGAYDFQYLWLAPDLYELDKKWLATQEIDLDLYAIYCYATKYFCMAKASELALDKTDHETAFKQLSFTVEELWGFIKKHYPKEKVSKASLVNFLDKFSSDPGKENTSFTTPGQRNSINSRPYIKLPNGRYFSPVDFNIAEAIYNMPWIWMMLDKSYKKAASQNRGTNVETLTLKIIKRAFGDNAYRSVSVKKNGKEVTDIDALALIGNKAIVFQCKSKMLTALSQQGDDESIAADFKAAIQDAYNQGMTSRKILLGQQGYIFEQEDGTTIEPSEAIDEVYIVCVTASVYPAVISQLEHYLQKDKDDPWPVPVSLLDLDLMTMYLTNPYDFLFYIKQRVELAHVIRSSGEIALLGYHLRNRLYLPPKADMIMVDQGYAQLIDADIMHKVGMADKPRSDAKLRPNWENKMFMSLLEEFKQIDQPQITDVILFWMQLSSDTVDEFTKHMERFITDTALKGKAHDFSAPIDSGSSGFTFVCASNMNELNKKLSYLANINKYRFKTDQWIALGTLVPQAGQLTQIATIVGYNNTPWEESSDMAQAVKLHEKSTKANKSKAPKATKKKRKKRKKRNKKGRK